MAVLWAGSGAAAERWEAASRALGLASGDDLTFILLVPLVGIFTGLCAVAIYKTIRSTNPATRRREHLHIIQSPNLSGVAIYTKGNLVVAGGLETYYLLVSSKRAL